mmetsp:Transcript_2726/g.10474  ORF Transcript_2726/g.10474 Transcript_2726/m.10474 type:complete len:259 (+) Transcript_2726:3166-3942(+)
MNLLQHFYTILNGLVLVDNVKEAQSHIFPVCLTEMILLGSGEESIQLFETLRAHQLGIEYDILSHACDGSIELILKLLWKEHLILFSVVQDTFLNGTANTVELLGHMIFGQVLLIVPEFWFHQIQGCGAFLWRKLWNWFHTLRSAGNQVGTHIVNSGLKLINCLIPPVWNLNELNAILLENVSLELILAHGTFHLHECATSIMEMLWSTIVECQFEIFNVNVGVNEDFFTVNTQFKMGLLAESETRKCIHDSSNEPSV